MGKLKLKKGGGGGGGDEKINVVNALEIIKVLFHIVMAPSTKESVAWFEKKYFKENPQNDLVNIEYFGVMLRDFTNKKINVYFFVYMHLPLLHQLEGPVPPPTLHTSDLL